MVRAGRIAAHTYCTVAHLKRRWRHDIRGRMGSPTRGGRRDDVRRSRARDSETARFQCCRGIECAASCASNRLRAQGACASLPADCRGWLKATGFRKTSVLPLTEAELILIVMATKYER